MTDFHRGDQLTLQIGGTAQKILVRLLGKGVPPDSPTGIIAGIIVVPENRRVTVVLEEDHLDIVQISVHGGTNPWAMYSLGGGNGGATIVSARRTPGI
jgi:hypothetical protein